MRVSFVAFWHRVRSSLWFIPSLMVGGGVVLSFLAVAADRRLIDAPGRTFLLYGGGADGARAVLGTVASSMMTVAGVVFSITIVALTLASQQFGPRVLRNFMEDRGNQVVLGTFIATFVYCLLVVRTVRGGEDYEFVPHIGVTGGVFFAIASLGVLIYFIHHVANSIRAESIIARVAADLDAAIERLYPAQIGDEEPEESLEFDPAYQTHTQLRAREDGYLQSIEHDVVIALAEKEDAALRFQVKPSDFIVRDQLLMDVYSRGTIDEKGRDTLVSAFIIGSDRTPRQDVEFPMQQLLQIAVRALSPGVNDPFTAMSAIDRITAGLGRLARRRFPSEGRKDSQQKLRVIAPRKTFQEILHSTLRPLRESTERSPLVADHLESALSALIPATDEDRGQREPARRLRSS